ncbi:MAG: Cyclin-dependent kinases regulatory subunit (Cell division control protein cks1) [Cirrosporium novae-zelandiae]|nr:MAG: Cyclin-dependent kinases regulatory subunit (Cell division control protein cks1) [Cirrosporium novae-zelandiae]
MVEIDIDMSRRNKRPRILSESKRERLDEFINSIHYSTRWSLPRWRVQDPTTPPFAASASDFSTIGYRHVVLRIGKVGFLKDLVYITESDSQRRQ